MNYECNLSYFSQFYNLVSEVSKDGTIVPEHVGVIRDCTIPYVTCAFSWLSKRK